MRKFDQGILRQNLIWPRRSGKDSFAINLAAKAAHKRVGTIYHFLPTNRQGRRVIWNGIDKSGRRIIDQAIPPQLRDRTVDDEMFIHMKCGSVYQVIGSDNYDAVVGTNPIGVIFSEWALSNPKAWDYIRPILTENQGFAIFITTPRGRNHAYELYQKTKLNPRWHNSHLTWEQTGHITQEAIDEERASGMAESRVQQEFYCSFDAVNVGQIYREYVEAIQKVGKVGPCPYDPRYPVETSMDLGHRDSTAIIFSQRVGPEIRIIDYHEDRGKKLGHYLKLIREKPYIYNRHIIPHDAANNTLLGDVASTMNTLGFQTTTAPKLRVELGIDVVRSTFPRFRIDNVNCVQLLRAMNHYHYEPVDEDEGTVKATPNHDWSSHPCDALRYLCVTPEDQGIIPTWARSLMTPDVGSGWQKDIPGGYDPLSDWRRTLR